MTKSSISPKTGIQSGIKSIGEMMSATMAKIIFLSRVGMRSSCEVSIINFFKSEKKVLSGILSIQFRDEST